MSKIRDLLKILSAEGYKADYARAKTNCTCIRCRNRAVVFRDVLAQLEYEVSALCQRCQDECFKG